MRKAQDTGTRKISVLHITQSSGGVQTFFASFLRYRDQSAFFHALMAPPDSPVYQTALKSFDAVHPLPMERAISPLKDLRAALKVAAFLRKNSFDIIHVHSSKAGLIGRLGARIAGHRRVVFQPHMFSFLVFGGAQGRFARIWERLAGRFLTTKLIATSPSEGIRAQDEVRIPARKVAVIMNGIDCERLQAVADRKSESAESGFVLMAARLTHSKNPMMFARVAHIVGKRKPTARFILLGTGYHDAFERPIREYIHAHGLEETLRLVPWMDYDKTVDVIKRCALYVSTSNSESFGYSVVEAMYLGKPIVGTIIDGTRDIIVHDETGLLVKPDDHDTMADNVLHLLENRMLREVYGALGKKRVEELFDAKKNVTLLEKVYRDLITGSM